MSSTACPPHLQWSLRFDPRYLILAIFYSLPSKRSLRHAIQIGTWVILQATSVGPGGGPLTQSKSFPGKLHTDPEKRGGFVVVVVVVVSFVLIWFLLINRQREAEMSKKERRVKMSEAARSSVSDSEVLVPTAPAFNLSRPSGTHFIFRRRPRQRWPTPRTLITMQHGHASHRVASGDVRVPSPPCTWADSCDHLDKAVW